MDGDIGVAEQLGKEMEECLASLARKMQLQRINSDALEEQEEGAEQEEKELTRCIKQMKDLELVYEREAAAAHRQLAIKSAQFQELTRQASERLSTKALQRETVQLRKMIRELEAQKEHLLQEEEEEEGAGDGAGEQAAMASLTDRTRALQKRCQHLAAQHGEVVATVRSAIAEAGSLRATREEEEQRQQEYCRQLEEAIEDMTLVQVAAELAREDDNDDEVPPAAAAPEDAAPPPRMASTRAGHARLATLDDECDLLLTRLSGVLEARLGENRKLAEDLGLLEMTSPTTSEDDPGCPVPAARAQPDDAEVARFPAPLSEQMRRNEDAANRVTEIVLESDSE